MFFVSKGNLFDVHFTLDFRASVRISFPDDNLSKHQWIFTKIGMCIDIVEIWFGIANGQISSNFDGGICRDVPIFFRFRMIT